ncbi:MAG: hypothetical protein VXZ35_09615 [Pseudomonadota bacterium]|nr:hypothetical protein [Pseudomonadota bacterium]
MSKDTKLLWLATALGSHAMVGLLVLRVRQLAWLMHTRATKVRAGSV